MAGGEEGFAEVAGYDLFRLADGGEVDTSIPVEEYIDVLRYMIELRGSQEIRLLTAPLARFGMTRFGVGDRKGWRSAAMRARRMGSLIVDNTSW